MHIKFLKSGRSGQRAVAYLLRERAAEDVIVRRGDPVFFADLVDSLDYTNPYSSAVIAFAPEDQPTEEQIAEVIEGFQQTAWAGLQSDDFCVLVVEHRRKDGKGTHLHFLVANYHISRKKHYNPAPPRWEMRYGLWRDYVNLRYGWARPDDEKRARKVQPGYLAFPGVAAEKRQVLAWAETMAEMGLGLREIAEIAQASGAEIVRSGNDYVTLAWGKQRVRVRIGKKEKKEVEAVTIEEQKRKWQRALEKLAEENQKRYGPKEEKKQGEKTHGRTGERRGTSGTGTGRDRMRGMPARNAAGENPGPRAGELVVLPSDVRLVMVRRYGRRVPRRMQRLGSERIRRIARGESEHGVRIQWAYQAGDGATSGGGRGDKTPPGGVRGDDAARHGGAGGAAPAAGHPGSGMAGLWDALERVFRCLGDTLAAVRRLYETVREFYEAACRFAAAGGMSLERGAEQAGQQPAARREEPKADVPKRDWPRQGWPPGRQGPGLG